MNPLDPIPIDSRKTASFVSPSTSEQSELTLVEQIKNSQEYLDALLLRHRQEQQALQHPEDISDKNIHAATSTSTTTPTTTNTPGKVLHVA